MAFSNISNLRVADVVTAPEDNTVKKRRKGATRLSCAECRRLKLRCDRAFPCGSCVKRGCRAICPDGSLTTGQGNRFVLASTQELHEKIHELANRIRDLEDALRSAHGQLSVESHPLLSEELLQIKTPLQRDPLPRRGEKDSDNEEEQIEHHPDVLDAFGSLSIGVHGRTTYFGQVANSWYFLQNEHSDQESDAGVPAVQSTLPSEILALSAAFPIALPSEQTLSNRIESLLWHLPPAAAAAELKCIYYSHASWMYNPIPQEAFDEQVYSQFYDPHASSSQDHSLVSHRLSLMFIVLAIGALMDPQLPPFSVGAEKYFQLAHASLFHNRLFEEPTISAVQALYLMSFYLFLADRQGTGSESRWAIMGLAVKMAQSIGLHRDSDRWNMDAVDSQRRRETFWELFTYDSWQSLTFGRPPSFSLSHVDCKLPFPSETHDEQSFHGWKHRYTSECMSVLHDLAFGAKTPTYATVLQLDRKLRAFLVPATLQVPGFGSSESTPGEPPASIMLTLQRHIVLALREMNLLYLHRSFFAKAISSRSKDPLASSYASSVLAAYRSAGSFVALMRNLHSQLKSPTERMWFLWGHMFSCSIVLGSIVTRCPSLSLAPSALVQLDSACELFAVAASGFRAQKVLAVMLRLQDKAHFSWQEYNECKPIRNGPCLDLKQHDEDDELSILGGKTRLVKKSAGCIPARELQKQPALTDPVVSPPMACEMVHQAHPNVVEYMGTFSHAAAQESHAMSSASMTSPGAMYTPTDEMFNMSPVPTSFEQATAYDTHRTSPRSSPLRNCQFQSHPQAHPASPHSPQFSSQPHTPLLTPISPSFSQYFPLYNYTTTNGDCGDGEHPYATPMGVPMVMVAGSRGSPEANMHTTWQDFVAGLGMN